MCGLDHQHLISDYQTYMGLHSMVKVIYAKYEHGVLKPLEKLDFKEGENVKLIVLRSTRELNKIVREISKEYQDAKEDPLFKVKPVKTGAKTDFSNLDRALYGET